MASTQIEFLKEAIASDVDTAIAKVPGALRDDEIPTVKAFNKDQLKSLLELREAAEAAGGIQAVHGSGYLSM